MIQLLERGDVVFAYRPRIDRGTATGPEDVQRFYAILQPDGVTRVRRLILGRKRLPRPERRERVWGFVDEVADRPDVVTQELDQQTYVTRTRGERVLPAARPAGEGVYGIVRHDDHTHLAYQLELPAEPGEVQQQLGIERQASYILSVRNPDAPAPPGAGLPPRERARLPEELRRLFGGRRFIDADPPALLDHPGVEFVLIGASADVRRELGLDLHPEHETLDSADVFRRLGLSRERTPVAPLVEGRWE
jgi:hypothetical protein